MDVFEIRKGLIKENASYTSSFIKIEDEVIGKKVQEEMEAGLCSGCKIQVGPD